MASLHMGECYPLNAAKLGAEVTRVSPGNYALGYVGGGTFIAFYVGRSDSDVSHRLHSWIGVDSRPTDYDPCAKAAPGAAER